MMRIPAGGLLALLAGWHDIDSKTETRMQRRLRTLVRPLALGLALAAAPAAAQQALRVASPDGRNEVTVSTRDGGLYYAVRRDGQNVLLPSRLGFAFRGADSLYGALRVTGTTRDAADETWTQPWGEVARVRDQHNELRVQVAEDRAPNRRFAVVFRAFDDGIGFRYELDESFGAFEMMEELTEFAFADNARAWWIPSNRSEPDRQEILYSSGPLSRLDSVQTPLTLQTSSGTQVVIHEANLVDYAGMYLARTGNRTLRSTLARWADGVAVRGTAPFVTPWRTIQLADRPEDLAPSVLTLKLNPPSRIEDTSWIRPMKYNGIWWSMHINLETWGSGPTHGATTANTRRYLDFAAANGLGGTLVEGWNTGWELNWFGTGLANFSFTQPYPDFDLPGLAAYARSKGLTLIGHHETATVIGNYERQLDSAMALYERVGVRAVKTGYVGDFTEQGHAHQSQYMVRHHRRVIETAARHGITIDVHEPVKDTGERRTWPNILSREGSRGMEYNAWGGDGGNPPEHETILFFTRMLAGPMDFTPGIFDLLVRSASGTPRGPEEARPRTTLAKQLALYVVLYSPLQMAADLPQNYEGQPAFQFIRDVAVDWDTTIVLNGRIGDHVIVARKEKGQDEWFVGAITDEEARTFEVPLGFLPAGRRYVAEIYADGPGANWRDNPLPIDIRRQDVDSGTTLHVRMAPGGGQAVRIRPAQ
jgi:alpha-glucosidase